jgi:hypothetical protein
MAELCAELPSLPEREELEIQRWRKESEEAIQELKQILAFYRKCSFLKKSSSGHLMTISAKATRSFWEIEKRQAKEYRELFPHTCSRVKEQDREQKMQQSVIPSLYREHGSQEAVHPDTTKRASLWGKIEQGARSRQGNWRSTQDGTKIDPTQMSARRGHRRIDLLTNRLHGKEHRGGACGRGQAPHTLANWLPSHADHIV